ncbi:MAG: Fic family protein [Chloroflexi bacterium]|nr:Fic family protein [Chloroflexota bacterium]
MDQAARQSRSGRYVNQLTGYRAFVPTELPPEPPVDLARLSPLVSAADQAIGRLDGVARMLPNPDLFVAMYVRREAVLSSQIEGTQSSLDDVLSFQLGEPGGLPRDVDEVVNHVAAMNHGLRRLDTLPLSLRLIREIHGVLMSGVRGSERTPGEFRTSQNWIGTAGAHLDEASFVPPPPHELTRLLGDLERFLHEAGPLPLLVHAGVAHAQFETIHPFLDGNGRVGRLLITLLLVHGGVLERPVLYLSYFLKRHRAEYYDRLMAVRDGDWEGWLDFFLRGVAETSRDATSTAASILVMREDHRRDLEDLGPNAIRLMDRLFEQPVVNVAWVQKALGVSWPTANKLITQLMDRALLAEVTGHRRNRVFRYAAYVDLFAEREPDLSAGPTS